MGEFLREKAQRDNDPKGRSGTAQKKAQ